MAREELETYNPGVSVRPPMFPATVPAQLERPEAFAYAEVRSAWAVAEAELLRFSVPEKVPGGNPVTLVPGLSPRSPVTAVAPVLVTVEYPRTA
jgi:hypothetical protein